MAAKEHKNFWEWASDHWFLTFLLAGSAIAAPAAIVRAIHPEPPSPSPIPLGPGASVAGLSGRRAPIRRLGAPGTSPFPGSFR